MKTLRKPKNKEKIKPSCGAYALGVLTRKDLAEVRIDLREVVDNNKIGMQINQMLLMLQYYGFIADIKRKLASEHRQHKFWTELEFAETVQSWIESAEYKPLSYYIIATKTHFITVHNFKILDAHNGRPTYYKKARYKKGKVDTIFEINKGR